jgi:hypothetical protein
MKLSKTGPFGIFRQALSLSLFVILSVCLARCLFAGTENNYESREAGFKITKPDNWQFLPTKTVAQNLALPRLRDKELERVIRSKPNVPFLVIARFPEPYEGVNPSVQVSFKTQGELLGQGAPALLNRVVERLKGNFRDFTFIRPVETTTLDGQAAARMVALYTVADAQGKEFKTVARMWVIPRGDYMFNISMYGAHEGPNASEKEFEQILQSIKIAPGP